MIQRRAEQRVSSIRVILNDYRPITQGLGLAQASCLKEGGRCFFPMGGAVLSGAHPGLWRREGLNQILL